MSTFLLFGGADFYPEGGWNDFKFAGSLEECQSKFTSWRDDIVPPYAIEGYPLDWAHIVDMSTRQKILVADYGEDKKVIWRVPKFLER